MVQIKWTVDTPELSGARGETLLLKITADIPATWHTSSLRKVHEFSTPTVFKAAPDTLLSISGKIGHPDPIFKADDEGGTEYFEGKVAFNIPVRVNPSATPGAQEAELSVTSTLCGGPKNVCLMETTKLLKFKLLVSNDPAKTDTQTKPDSNLPPVEKPRGEKSDATKPGGAANMGANDIAKARDQGLIYFLWLAALAGVTSWLTPCVFPMIPITVTFFTKRKQATRAKSLRDAATFSLGIIGTFVLLGFGFTLLLGATAISNFASNPWVNLAVAAIFVTLAMNLFGFFEIQVPSGVVNALNAKANKDDGVLSILLMGLVFSLTSFTCTVPFVGGVMVAATQGDYLWPLLGLMVYAAVFSLPFFLLALFPAALKSLPKSGGWLNSVKVIMGFMEIAAAMKFLSNADLSLGWGVLSRNVFLSIWIVLALLSAVYLLGKIRFPHDTPVNQLGRLRVALAASFVLMALFLGGGMFGLSLGYVDSYAPPAKLKDGEHWLRNLDDAVAEAKRTGRPLFLDFTGFNCNNCRRMETAMFPRPEIQKELERHVRVKLYTDDKTQPEQSQRYFKILEARFQKVALPYYAILTPDDQVLGTFEGMTENAGEFAEFLRKSQK
jgi:thiol:disulfide interchange protein DsbD